MSLYMDKVNLLNINTFSWSQGVTLTGFHCIILCKRLRHFSFLSSQREPKKAKGQSPKGSSSNSAKDVPPQSNPESQLSSAAPVAPQAMTSASDKPEPVSSTQPAVSDSQVSSSKPYDNSDYKSRPYYGHSRPYQRSYEHFPSRHRGMGTGGSRFPSFYNKPWRYLIFFFLKVNKLFFVYDVLCLKNEMIFKQIKTNFQVSFSI